MPDSNGISLLLTPIQVNCSGAIVCQFIGRRAEIPDPIRFFYNDGWVKVLKVDLLREDHLYNEITRHLLVHEELNGRLWDFFFVTTVTHPFNPQLEVADCLLIYVLGTNENNETIWNWYLATKNSE